VKDFVIEGLKEIEDRIGSLIETFEISSTSVCFLRFKLVSRKLREVRDVY
jgi:hypothetical protein